MKLLRKIGSTSEIWQIFIQDSSSTTGAGLAGLAFGTSGLTAYFHRDTDTTATAITLVDMTVGTFTSSGFKEIDDTNMPGWYQFCPPNAALASGAKSCAFHLQGATDMAPLPIEVDLDGHVSEVTGNVTGNVNGNVGGNVTGNVGGNVTGTVGSVVGNVGGNVTGTVASVVGNVGGNVVGNVNGNVVGSVASVTGNVGGNVTGTVGSVVGNVGGNVVGSVASVTGNVGGNVVGTIGGFTAASLAQFFTTDTTKVYADAVTGSVVKENALGSIAGTITAAGVRAAVGLASANLDTQLAAIDADVLTRLPTSSYVAPHNTNIDAIKTKTDQFVFTTPNQVDANVITKTGFALSSSGLDAIVPDEITGAPTWGITTVVGWMAWVGAMHYNPRHTVDSQDRLRDSGDTLNLATAPLDDDGATFTRGVYS